MCTLQVKILPSCPYRAQVEAYYSQSRDKEVWSLEIFMPQAYTFESGLINQCNTGIACRMLCEEGGVAPVSVPFVVTPTGFIAKTVAEFSVDLIGSPRLEHNRLLDNPLIIPLRGSMSHPTTYTSSMIDKFAKIAAPGLEKFKIETNVI